MMLAEPYFKRPLMVDLFGDVERVFCFTSYPSTDAPGCIISVKFREIPHYGHLELLYSPRLAIESNYYATEDTIEITGSDGIIFLNGYFARMTNSPLLMMKHHDRVLIPGGLILTSYNDAIRHCTDSIIAKVIKPGKYAYRSLERAIGYLKVIEAALTSIATGSKQII